MVPTRAFRRAGCYSEGGTLAKEHLPVTPVELAAELGISDKTLRQWLRTTYPRPRGSEGASWVLTPEQIDAARQRWAGGSAWNLRAAGTTTIAQPSAARSRSRSESDEAYVIDLCDEVLGEAARRQHAFPWLCGDPGKNGRAVCLPVDAYYEGLGLVVEYRERQHDEPTPFFDRRQTVSGVGRGEQRRLYDLRREAEIPRHGLRLVIIKPGDLDADSRGRLRRNHEKDVVAVRHILHEAH